MSNAHSSLAATIGWVSTCLLAAGVSTLFDESSRLIWMTWGSFGLVAAVGLDVTARVRERKRQDSLNVIANRRYEREMKYEIDDKEANAAVRQAVTRLLGFVPRPEPGTSSRRSEQRHCCDLEAKLLLHPGLVGSAINGDKCTLFARVTNLSASGFELLLTEQLPQRRMEMIITTITGGRQRMFGEVLWDVPQEDGTIVAGGRFFDAVAVESQ